MPFATPLSRPNTNVDPALAFAADFVFLEGL